MNRLLFIALVSGALFLACSKDKTFTGTTPYVLEIPSHFPEMQIPADNPMTKEGVELGRMLFYEKMLSLDNSISCGSCHAPGNAFSDPAQFSAGVNGTLGNRNSMALMNLGWQQFFFWDGRAKTLEAQILEPIPNPVEMHQSWSAALKKLKESVEYRNAFFKAFGEEEFNEYHAAKAIAQFLRTMISGSAKYDVMYKIENDLPLTSEEQSVSISIQEWEGYDLFKSLNGADCFHCHNGALMQVQKFSNNGLDANFTDLGRGAVTGLTSDHGKFKVPSLRNIALSAPYMHDGRFQTLDDVIEHYSSGVVSSPTIDPLMEFSFQGGVQLTSEQKQSLKAFLLTLTDEKFVTNPNFQPLNP